jgi:hypothetical protein
MISEIDQETSDIDWFFTDGEMIGFVASGGGRLPNSISRKSIEEIELLADYFRRLPQTGEIDINPSSRGQMIRPYTFLALLKWRQKVFIRSTNRF